MKEAHGVATGDKLVTLDDLKAAYDNVHIPSKQLQITTGQWSGSGPYTITASATNVTANSIVDWQMDSSINYLASDLTVTTGAGTVTLSTATKPTNTINITLFFPGTTDDVDVQVLSDVYSKSQVDTLLAAVTITSQYTTVLAAINAYRNTKPFPFTIQKSGNTTYYDIPSGVANTCEWNVTCTGDSRRITALLTVYSGASSNNGRTFIANIFEGEYSYNFADVQSMAGVLHGYDVINNLTSTDTDKPLSAAMGKELSNRLETRTFDASFTNVAAGAGASVSVAINTVPGKTPRIVTVSQTSQLNLFPVWLDDYDSSNASARCWNGRTSAVTSCSIRFTVLYW